jgi:hypothetical protein
LRETVLPTAVAHQQEPSPPARRLLLLLLAVALVRGVLSVALVPPWQHYDEPTHFEYVRLIAERGQLPQPDDYDVEMRREIVASMKATGLWKGSSAPAPPFWSDQALPIGLSELRHPPLYYALLALPQRLAAQQSVETQLYLARLTSLALGLLVVVSAYGLLAEMLPRRRYLPLAAVTFLVLLPPVADLLSAVNSDVGAAAVSSLLLWASVRLIRRGPSPRRVGAVLLLAGGCVVTKSTSAQVAVVVLLALLAIYVPQSWRRWLRIGCALLGLGILAMALTWGRHAAHWYGFDGSAAASRVQVETPWGLSALALSVDDNDRPSTVVQELSLGDGRALRDQTVTFGAWLKANEGAGGDVVLRLGDGKTERSHCVQVTAQWQFEAFSAVVSMDAPGVAVYASIPDSEGAAKGVYVDGLVLADGEMPVGSSPEFDTIQAVSGQWGGQRFANLLKNGSAERGWPGLRARIGRIGVYRQPVALVFHSVWDWTRNAWAYSLGSLVLFESFWGKFGWGDVALPSICFYPLGLVSAAAVIGAGIGLVRRARSFGKREPWQRRAWSVLGLVLLVGWAGAILRVHPVFLVVEPSQMPVARYAAVVLVPTVGLLCLGLAEIVPRRWVREAAYAGLLGMVSLDVIAMWAVMLPWFYG